MIMCIHETFEDHLFMKIIIRPLENFLLYSTCAGTHTLIWLFFNSKSSSHHSNLVLLQVNVRDTSKCSVGIIRSVELMTWFNVHQSTRAELRDSLMYHCHTVSGRTVQEGTGDANTSWGGVDFILNLKRTYKALFKINHDKLILSLPSWVFILS